MTTSSEILEDQIIDFKRDPVAYNWYFILIVGALEFGGDWADWRRCLVQ